MSEKQLIIKRVIPYEIHISGSGYNIYYDENNETNLFTLMANVHLFDDIIESFKKMPHVSKEQKKEIRDEITKYTKLKLQCEKHMSEIAIHLLNTKTQADYDVENAKHPDRKKDIIELPKENLMLSTDIDAAKKHANKKLKP